MIFEIYGATESPEDNPMRTWEFLTKSKTLIKSIRLAKRYSKKLHEVEIRGTKEGETIHHSYWRNGSLEINLFN